MMINLIDDILQCAVVGRRLTVLQWKHNAAWTAWCSAADTDTVEGFLHLKDFNASETPSLVTIIENTDSINEWTLCCGIRHHFEHKNSSYRGSAKTTSGSCIGSLRGRGT